MDKGEGRFCLGKSRADHSSMGCLRWTSEWAKVRGGLAFDIDDKSIGYLWWLACLFKARADYKKHGLPAVDE